MIKEFEFYHGAALIKLLHESVKPISIESFPSSSNASYIINKNIGIFIKHSSKRLSPWRFSFLQEHQNEILNMKNLLDEVFVLLVCGEDGVVVVSFDELKQILNSTHDSIEWVSVARSRNTEYTVKGSDGDLKYKVSKRDFPRKIIDFQPTTKKRGVFDWLK